MFIHRKTDDELLEEIEEMASDHADGATDASRNDRDWGIVEHIASQLRARLKARVKA